MGGAGLALVGLAVIAFGPAKDQTPGRVARDLAVLGLTAVSVSMGVGILKYHLHDIDRIHQPHAGVRDRDRAASTTAASRYLMRRGCVI